VPLAFNLTPMSPSTPLSTPVNPPIWMRGVAYAPHPRNPIHQEGNRKLSTAITEPTGDEADLAPEPTVEQVAKTIEGISTIGEGRNALAQKGWTATIVAQHIYVNLSIVVQYIGVNGSSWWNVYAEDGTPPVWTVGSRNDPGNWAGAE
jgi:hypothetical protein